MMIDPIYYAVFFDVDLPQDFEHARNKRLKSERQFINLTDGLEGKQVQLEDAIYEVISFQTFSITNTVDNHFFAVIQIKRIDNETLQTQKNHLS